THVERYGTARRVDESAHLLVELVVTCINSLTSLLPPRSVSRLSVRPVFLFTLSAALVPLSSIAAQQAARKPALRAAIPGLDAASIDSSVRPGDDFYRYANGGWDRATTIPSDRSSLSGFSIADARSRVNLRTLVRRDAAAHGVTGDRQRIGAFYTAFLDTVTLARRGMTPLRPMLDSIAHIDDRTALARWMGTHLRADVDVLNNGALHTENLFGLWVDANFNQPTRTAAILLQGGIGMPDRSYYLDSTSKMAALRDAYRAHVERMLTLAKMPNAKATADTILALETRIAQAHWTQEDSWEPTKGNNHWARTDFATKAPGLDWDAFFRAARLADLDTLVAWQASAISGLSALVANQPLPAFRALLTYHAIEHRAAELSPEIDREAFAFFGHTLSGAPEQATRAERALDATSAALGFAVGREYVTRFFPASAKTRAQRMVNEIVAAFDRRIDSLAWMAPATKAEAKRKLKTLRVGIGYPDKWPGYDKLRVLPNDSYGNAERVERFQYGRAIEALHQPLDRTEWVMTPQLVNAVNMPQRAALNFPAAILQPPFFDPTRSDAMNYGAIGAVIGHEVSHSFDNIGSGFDAETRLRNWWTPEDFAHFNEATGRLVRQYDAYRPFPDVSINGRLTLAENIADLAGVTAAYDAWRATLGGKSAPSVGGLTGDQQFFLAFGQMYRSKFREAALHRTILTNGHSPGMYRALTVRNLDAWYEAFGVKPGDKLYLAPGERVRLW
ncbi:MAG: M13 family metallopeptidase, partial [Gemmatimonadaceae bacterium]